MTEYDLHLSATRISPQTVKTLSALGFARDEFLNNTRCLASDYHGTYRGAEHLPNETLWRHTCDLLKHDPIFVGGLEEESMDSRNRIVLPGNATVFPPPLAAIALVPCSKGVHKACDIHVSVSLEDSTEAVLAYVEAAQMISFDKVSAAGPKRVYTVTCEKLSDGLALLEALRMHLCAVPNLRGVMKLEATTRFFRNPADAPTLPIMTSSAVESWLGMSSCVVRHQ